MTASWGVVLLSADQQRAVFLTGTDLTNLEETLDAIVQRPTVAGETPDVAGLARLTGAVELAKEGNAPTILSAIEEAALELLKNQAAVRSNLPLRIRRTCQECGHEQIVNPARQPRTATPSSGSSRDLDTVVDSISLLSDGHPFLAALNLLGGGSANDSSVPEPQQPVCGRCDGENFGSAVVTICPGCRAFRDESILLICPECGFDFLSRRAHDEFWVPPAKAVADAALARNAALLREKATDFENSLWPGQLQALLAALRHDEQLVGMCRCRVPNEVGRYVALLLTSHQLVWTRESPMKSATSGNVPWSEVLAVRRYIGTGSANDRGIQLEVRNGAPLVFNDFRGLGITFTAESTGFTVDSMYMMVNQLWRPYHPAQVTAAPAVHQIPRSSSLSPPDLRRPPPPQRQHGNQPARSAPGPGWYPDPWRAARLRWWNGAQWTAYLSP